MEPILRIDGISKSFSLDKKHRITAVQNLNLDVFPGETLGIVGESGCGKTTLGRMIAGIYTPDSGQICYKGKTIDLTRHQERMEYSKHVQMVFQNPYSSLDPRMSIGRIISEGMEIHGMYGQKEREERVFQLLDRIGLPPDSVLQYPREFSGGQLQRISIARALAMEPELLILDEPVSALDVSVQGQIVNLLKSLQSSLGLTYLFISHDLNIIRYLSKRIAVMYMGKLVELADKRDLFSAPEHPYSKVLLNAILPPVPTDGVFLNDKWGTE